MEKSVKHFDWMYGTAWKEEKTQGLVMDALESGFRAIDTANQRKHYFEAAVGAALTQYLQSGRGNRDDLFIQTKYTFQAGQDHRLPYDPSASISDQVHQSVQKSKEHLGIETIDSLVLHGPTLRYGLHQNDWDAWKSMEGTVAAGDVVHLGISNCSAAQLEELLDGVDIKPRFVQNRCYAILNWDADVRAICQDQNIIYQGFSLLTANTHFMQHPLVHEIAARFEKWPSQIVFRYCMDIGILPITGTSDVAHMKGDLECSQFELSDSSRNDLDALSLAVTKAAHDHP